MKLFRGHILSRLITLITGIIFLNLSFILTEINSLELKENNVELYNNIVRMVSGIGAEEEKDVAGETESSAEKEVNIFCINHGQLTADYYLITCGLHASEQNLKLLSGNHEITTPPPKIS